MVEAADQSQGAPAPPAPLLATRIVHHCQEIGGDDDQELALGFRQEGWKWGADDSLEPRWSELIRWWEIETISVSKRQTVGRRAPYFLSIPLGRFTPRGKARSQTYLIVELVSGKTRTFRVGGMDVEHLREHLRPVTDWLARYREQLQAAV